MQRHNALDLRWAAWAHLSRLRDAHASLPQRDDAAVLCMVCFAPGVPPFPSRDLDALPLPFAPVLIVVAGGLEFGSAWKRGSVAILMT